jgi:spore coat protein U-like protein
MKKLLINLIFCSLLFSNKIFANKINSHHVRVAVHVPAKCILYTNPIDFGTLSHTEIKNHDITSIVTYYVTCTKNLHYRIEVGKGMHCNRNLVDDINNKLPYTIYKNLQTKKILDITNPITGIATGEKTAINLYQHLFKNSSKSLADGLYQDSLDVNLIVDNNGSKHETIYHVPVRVSIR